MSSQGTIKLCDFGSSTTIAHYPDYNWSAQKRATVEEEVGNMPLIYLQIFGSFHHISGLVRWLVHMLKGPSFPWSCTWYFETADMMKQLSFIYFFFPLDHSLSAILAFCALKIYLLEKLFSSVFSLLGISFLCSKCCKSVVLWAMHFLALSSRLDSAAWSKLEIANTNWKLLLVASLIHSEAHSGPRTGLDQQVVLGHSAQFGKFWNKVVICAQCY